MALTIHELELGAAAPDAALWPRACAPAARAEWHWRHAENPHGRRVFLAREGERVVGQFAAVPHAAWIGREAVFAEWIGNFGPRAGSGLARQGVYARLGRALLEKYGAPGGDLVHYGIVAGGEWRVVNGLLEGEVVRNLVALVRAVGDGPRDLPAGVERLTRFDHQAKWLWDRVAGAMPALTVRDEAFLNWRFVTRPERAYELVGVRDAGGILRGYAVLAVAEFGGRRALWLVDFLVPREEPEVARLLLAAAAARARAAGERELATLVPEWSPWFDDLQRAGFLVHPLTAFLFARPFARKFDEVWLRDHWWFTLADTLHV
jgi:hypothetical protein